MRTVWTDNVEAFVQRRDETGSRIDLERHAGVHAAMRHLTGARRSPGAAFYTLMRSVRRQWLLAGIGELQLGPEASPSEVMARWGGPR